MHSVLWRCWLGGRKGIRPLKKLSGGCCHGYMSGVHIYMAQQMPLPLTISYSSKSRLVLPSWFLADHTIGRAFGTLCHLSVCRLSVTVCIMEKRYVLAKNCLKEWIENQGQKVDFWGWCHISTSGFASVAAEMVVFALFLPVQPIDRYYTMSGKNGTSNVFGITLINTNV